MSEPQHDEPEEEEREEPAPIGTWRGMYVALAALLVAEIVVFYWLSRHFG